MSAAELRSAGPEAAQFLRHAEPPPLEQLQEVFQHHLLHGSGEIAAALARAPGVSAEQRLAIYHHAYRVRLVAALRDSHGHTARFMGDDRFDGLALDYVAGHPPDHANLRWYGTGFAGWLAQHCADVPAAGELAVLDAALRRAFDGPDAAVLSLADLAALPPQAWAEAVLEFHPTCQRLAFGFNTAALWQALDDDREPPAAQRLPQPGPWLVWRSGWQPQFRSLGALEAAALDRLMAGLDFGRCCEQLAATFPGEDIAQQAGALLRRWVDEQLLSGLRAGAS
jgi:hypothetical protein